MIDTNQLRKYVIVPVLKDLDLWSQAAEELLVLTAAQESAGGKYLHQLMGGPAVGIFQMEPATHDDIWVNYLEYRQELGARIRRWEIPFAYPEDNAQEMAGNLYYAAAMCRVHYLRVPKALPDPADLFGLAKYWKVHYNTLEGKGTIQEAIDSYKKYI